MSLPKLTITGGAVGHSLTVLLDGKPIPGLREAKLEMGIDHVNLLTLEVLVGSLDIDVEALADLLALHTLVVAQQPLPWWHRVAMWLLRRWRHGPTA